MLSLLQNVRNATIGFLVHQCPFAVPWRGSTTHEIEALFVGTFAAWQLIQAAIVFNEDLVGAIVLFHACIMQEQNGFV